MRALILDALVPDGVLTQQLIDDGFQVSACDSVDDALHLAAEYNPDMFCIGNVPRNHSPEDVVRVFRARQPKIPILVCTFDTDQATVVKCLNGGADDVIRRPIHSSEYKARSRALVRRSLGHGESEITVGPLMINTTYRQVRVGEKTLRLTGTEYRILEALGLRAGKPMSRTALLTHLYGGMDEPDIKILDVYICKLRQKLKAVGVEGHLGTAWGYGYSLSAQSSPENIPKPTRKWVGRSQQDAVFETMSPGVWMTTQQVVRARGVSSTAAVRDSLLTLNNKGRIERDRHGRDAVWRRPGTDEETPNHEG